MCSQGRYRVQTGEWRNEQGESTAGQPDPSGEKMGKAGESAPDYSSLAKGKEKEKKSLDSIEDFFFL